MTTAGHRTITAEQRPTKRLPAEDDAAADQAAADEAAAEEPEAEVPAAEEPAAEEEQAAEEPEPVADAEEGDAEATSAPPKFVANNRPEALALVEKVLAYYRAAEPSSPVALILERALALSSKNFIGLLREVLPDGHLKVKGSPPSEPDKGGWS